VRLLRLLLLGFLRSTLTPSAYRETTRAPRVNGAGSTTRW